jgi:hypothetical protein
MRTMSHEAVRFWTGAESPENRRKYRRRNSQQPCPITDKSRFRSGKSPSFQKLDVEGEGGPAHLSDKRITAIEEPPSVVSTPKYRNGTMKKFLIPATLLIAATLGGAAFAGTTSQAESGSLYGQPNPFAAVQTPAHRQMASELNLGSQQASRAYVPQSDWQQQTPAANERYHDPE